MQPYNYTAYKPDYYTFTTTNGYEYHCYFLDFSYAFEAYPNLASKVFSFNLELKSKPLCKINGLDKRIGATVAAILHTFLNAKENAAVYICDNSDNHEKARFHKFMNWFNKYNDGTII